MPSFFHPFAGLSCLNCSAIAVDTVAEQEMLDAFAGRPTSDSTSLKNHSDDEAPLLPPTKANAMYPDKHSTRSSRSIYSNSASRRASMRSTLSRADSCLTTQSGISVRSTPWYMKHISPSIIFWNGEENHDNMMVDRDGGTTHRSSSIQDPPRTSGYQVMAEDDHEVTTEDYDESEEEEYIFCDSTSGSGSSVANEPSTLQRVESTTHNIEEFMPQKESFRVSTLLGPSIVRLHATNNDTKVTAYPTDGALQNSALVGLYFAKADQCEQTTEYVRLFTAGYYHSSLDVGGDNDNNNNNEKDQNELQALSIVFCNANEDEDDMVVPPNLPSEWYTLPRSESTTDIQRLIRNELDIVTTAGPTLVVFDPISGHIVCSNAILDILHLDRSDADQYDVEAFQLYDSWLQQLTTTPEVDEDMRRSGRTMRLEQCSVADDDAGLVTMEYVDGERSRYERSLPYSI